MQQRTRTTATTRRSIASWLESWLLIFDPSVEYRLLGADLTRPIVDRDLYAQQTTLCPAIIWTRSLLGSVYDQAAPFPSWSVIPISAGEVVSQVLHSQHTKTEMFGTV
jgi:hypothetical protein